MHDTLARVSVKKTLSNGELLGRAAVAFMRLICR
jgi:hypothetical protein